VTRDDRPTASNGFATHERRAALARAAFAVELDNAVTVTRQGTRKLVPFVYGVVVFGALLGIVAMARLTRRPSTALVRITLVPSADRQGDGSTSLGSRFRATIFRPIFRGLAFALARIALQRFAASPRLTAGASVNALTAAAVEALSLLQEGQSRPHSLRGRG
jgi:hypothetical protein